jgi:EmrB/QacA subfamily drug resistance transporter
MSSTAPDTRRRLALTLLCTASFMVILDASIVVSAVPSVERHLGFTPGGVQWVLTAYVITFGGLLLLGGRAADLVGRRRLLMAGIGLFTLSSLLCGLSWSAGVLIGARAIQGVSAAVMTPTALSIVVTMFEEGPERNQALAVWGAVAAVGGAAGSIIGGPIIDGLGWQWIFLINVPIGLALVGASRLLLPADPGRREERARGLDLGGAVTATGAVGLLVYGVSQAPEEGWTGARTMGGLVAFALLVVAFLIVEARSLDPLVPLRMFRSRALVAGNLVSLACGMGAFGQGFLLTQYSQQVLGWSATRFGLSVAVMPVLAVVGSMAGQRLVGRLGVRPVAVVSMAMLGIAFVCWTGLSVRGDLLHDMLPGLLIFGPALGAAGVAAAIAAVGGAPGRDSGLASGINTAAFQVGGSLGVAIVSTTAVSRAAQVLAGHQGQVLLALTQGFRLAAAVGIGFALLGALAGLVLRLPLER